MGHFTWLVTLSLVEPTPQQPVRAGCYLEIWDGGSKVWADTYDYDGTGGTAGALAGWESFVAHVADRVASNALGPLEQRAVTTARQRLTDAELE